MAIHVLNTALPVFAALFIGVLCRIKNILSRADIAALRKLAVDITLPAVLFSAFATAEYTGKSVLIPLIMFAVCLTALLLGFLLKKLFRQRSPLMPYLMTGFEAGVLGYGLFALLYPGEGSAAFAIIDLGQVLFVFTVYKGLLMGKGSARELVRQAITSPVMCAIVAGILFGATGLFRALEPSGISGILSRLADFIAAPSSVLILISLGYEFEPKRTPWKKVLTYTGMRVFVMGVLLAVLIVINRRLLGGMMHEGALVLMMALPASYSLTIFTDAEGEQADIASTLSVMTLLSLLLFSVMAAFTI